MQRHNVADPLEDQGNNADHHQKAYQENDANCSAEDFEHSSSSSSDLMVDSGIRHVARGLYNDTGPLTAVTAMPDVGSGIGRAIDIEWTTVEDALENIGVIVNRRSKSCRTDLQIIL